MTPKEIAPRRNKNKGTKNGIGRPEILETNRKKYQHKVLLNEADETKFQQYFIESGKRNSSDFLYEMVFTNTRTVVLKDKRFDDLMPILIRIEKEINAIGINYNQATKAINQQSKSNIIPQNLVKELIAGNEATNKLIEQLLVHLDKITEKWL